MTRTDQGGCDATAPGAAGWRARSVLLLSTALQAAALSPAAAQPAPNARPTGGQVVTGQAGIAQTQAQTTIDQASRRAAVNWQSFDVGANHTVRFRQPSADAVTLNRVVGPNPSEIAGRIQANGQVVVVNQSGVLFHKGAQIDTAGLVVSAAGISNGNFMSGRMVFDQPAKPGAKVENRGTITVRQQGLAALVAPQVANAGVIRAKMGTVILGGAEAHTLDLYGDGMVSINVTRQVRTAPDGSQALVTNTGTVAADGGRVLLTAEAVDGVVQTLVNTGGRTRADTLAGRDGQVVIAGRGGNVIVAGTVTADGRVAGSRGGRIAINTTGTVAVTKQARISASGPAGGGTIAVGTTLARATGGPTTAGQPAAKSVTVAHSATLAANATISGKGGTIAVLSSGTTRVNGALQARGGAEGGDGGMVELSGGQIGSATGQVDVGAPAGRRGSILLDPDVLTIVDGNSGAGSQDGTFTGGSGTIVAGDPSVPPDTLSNGVLNGFTGDVVLQANQAIHVQADVNLNQAAGQSLTLQAGGTITVDTGIVLAAAGDVTLATGGAGGGTPPAAQPSPLISVLGTVTSGSGAVSLLGGTGGVISVAATGRVAGAGALLTATGTGTIAVAGSAAATGTLALTADRITIDGAIAGSSATALTAGTGGVALNGGAVLHGGTIAIQAAGPITANFGAAIGQAGAVVDLSTTTGGISQSPGATITAATLRSSLGVTGDTALMGVNNKVDTIGSFAVGGSVTNNFTLIGTTDIRLDGPLSAPGNIAVGTFGQVVLAGTASAGDMVLALASSGGVLLEPGAHIDGGRIALIANNGSITLAPGAHLGRAGALVDLTATGGGITQDPGATILAGTLRSAGGAAGSVDLAGTANAIAAIGGFAVTGGTGGFHAVTSGNLSIAGPLTAPGAITLTSGASGQIVAAGSIAAGTGLTLQGGSPGVALNTGAVLTAPTIVAQTAGAILIDTGTRLGQAGGIVDLSAGGITQSAGGTLLAGILRSTSGVTGAVSLAGSANAVGTIAAFAVSGPGGDLLVRDSAALRIDGPVTAPGHVTLATAAAGGLTVNGTIEAGGSITLLGTAGPVALNGGAVVSAPAIAVRTGTGGLAIAAGATLGRAGAMLDLATTGGGITEDPAATLLAGTITSTTGITGTVALPGSANAIGAFGALAVTGGGLSAFTTGDLAVTGPLTASGDIALRAAGTVGIAGTIGAGGTLAVTSDLAGIALAAGAVAAGSDIRLAAHGPVTIGATARLGQAGAMLDLSTTAGGVTQDPGGTVVAAVLRSAAGITGDVSLPGTNAIGGLGDIALSGSGARFLLADTQALTIGGTVAAPSGTVYLHVPAGVTVAAAGAIDTAPDGEVSVQAPSLAVAAGGTIATGALWFGPATQGGTAVLGSAAGLPSLAGVSAGTVTLGAVTIPGVGPVTTAGSIVVAGTFDAAHLPLRLRSSGGIDGTAAPLRDAASLSGQADGDVILSHGANTIGTLDGFQVDGAGHGFTLKTGFALLLTGAVTAPGDIDICACGSGALTVGGTVAAGGSVSLGSGGALVLTAGARAFGALVALSAGAGIDMQAGAVAGQAGGVVDLATSAGGVTQDAGATIIAATLRSAGGVAGDVTLGGAANAIGALGPFAVGGSDFTLLNTGTIDIAGPLTAPNDIRITSDPGGGIVASGSVIAGGTLALSGGSGGIALQGGARVAAPHLTLMATAPITLAGGAYLGQAGAALDLSTTAGGVTQDAGATIVAATLGSGLGLAGHVSLTGSANAIGTLTDIAVAGGDFVLHDTGHLAVAGTLTADQVALTAGAIDVTGRIAAAAGTVALLTTAGTLGLGGLIETATQASLTSATALTQSGTVIAGGSVTASAGAGLSNTGTIAAVTGLSLSAANDLTNRGTLMASGGGVAHLLATSGTLSQAGTLRADSVAVTAATGSITQSGLTEARAGAAAFTAGAGFIQTGGTVQAARAGLTIDAGSSFTQTGGTILSAGAIDLSATDTILQTAGAVLGTGGGTMTLAAGAGSVTQESAGRIEAGGAGGRLAITAAQAVALAGTVQATDPQGVVSVTAGGPLTQSGTVSAGAAVTLTGAGDLTNTGLVQATAATGAVTLTSQNGGLTQAGLVLSGGSVRETAGSALTHSGVSQAGSLGLTLGAGGDIAQQAGTIQASGDIDVTAAGSLNQDNASIRGSAVRLTVQGGLNQGPSGVIAATSGGGSVGITVANLLTQAGTIAAGGSITASAAGIIQPGTISAGAAAALTATGALTQTGRVSAGTQASLIAGTSLTQAGTVRAGTTATVSATNGLAQTGTVAVPGGTASLATATGPLRQTGAIEAGRILFANQAGPIAITGRLTGLTPASQQPQAPFAIPSSRFPTPGTDTGIFILAGSASGPAIPQTVTFDAAASATSGRPQLAINVLNDQPVTLGVAAPGLDLFLAFLRGPAGGTLDVASLHVGYQAPGTAGSVDLDGIVDGLTGYSAASASFIQPQSRANYLLNGCPIQSFNCVQITTIQVPVTNPLQDVQTYTGRVGSGVLFSLPDVAERDF